MSPEQLQNLEPGELYEALLRHVGTAARLRVYAETEKLKGRVPERWAAYRSAQADADTHIAEVARRLGVPWGNSALQKLASWKQGKVCARCGNAGGYKARTLNYFTADGQPTAHEVARDGGTVEQVRAWVDRSQLFCIACAKRLYRARFSATGKLILK